MTRLANALAVAVFMVVCATVEAAPQSTIVAHDPLSVLALPEGQPIVCRVPEPDTSRRQAVREVIREFLFGSPSEGIATWPREISVVFDSVGHAVLLSDDASFGIRGSQSVIARFHPAGDVTGRFILVTVDSVALAAALARGDIAGGLAAVRPPAFRDLSRSEGTQARVLAAWLWEHRCNR
jgi:hypothetical protein